MVVEVKVLVVEEVVVVAVVEEEVVVEGVMSAVVAVVRLALAVAHRRQAEAGGGDGARWFGVAAVEVQVWRAPGERLRWGSPPRLLSG